jgi:glycosyltransferase involved in cell wall biosynthesis
MKILHAILSEGFYGSERYCIELATAQARVGHTVEVLIVNDRSDCARAFRREIDETAAAIAQDGTTGAIDLAIMPGWLPATLHRAYARRVLASFAPDIVHSHLNPAARRVGQLAQRKGVPHVATIHIRYEKREHSGCDGLICYSGWQRAGIDAEFRGEIQSPVVWLPVAIRTALARVTPAEVAALRRTWNADDGTVVLGSIGRLMPEKGMDVLVRAFRAAFPHGDEPVRLVIVGGGSPDQTQALQALIGGDARITLSGPPPAIALYYRAFDTYVSAARFEPFGLTILEAMDAGCALVVTRTEGPREFLTDPFVLWAEPDDAATLAPQLRAAVARGRARRSYDLSPYTQSHAVAAVEELYRRVLAKTGGQRREASPKPR